MTIFLQCFYLLWTRRNNTQYSYRFLAFVIATFALGTISVISLSIVNQFAFIDYRNIPGGPTAFAAQDSSTPVLVVTWSSVIGMWLTGGLLVSILHRNLENRSYIFYSYINLKLWRGLMVYNGSIWSWIMLFPGLIYLAEIGKSVDDQ